MITNFTNGLFCALPRIRTFSPTGKSRLRYQLRHESICICLSSGDMSCTCILWASTTRVDYFRHSRIIIPHRETSTTTQELPRAYLNRFCLNRVIILFLYFLLKGRDSDPRRRKPSHLQCDVFDRFTYPSFILLLRFPVCFFLALK